MPARLFTQFQALEYLPALTQLLIFGLDLMSGSRVVI